MADTELIVLDARRLLRAVLGDASYDELTPEQAERVLARVHEVLALAGTPATGNDDDLNPWDDQTVRRLTDGAR